MSLIVYDQEPESDLSVVLHDPSRNALVFHDPNANQFQLIRTNSEQFPNHRRNSDGFQKSFLDSFSDQFSSETCPHCGSSLHNTTGKNDEYKQIETMIHKNRRNSSRSDAYINRNYFRLLARSSNYFEDQKKALSNGGGTNVSDIYQSIPDNLFTPNYFEKFFKIDKLLGTGSNAKVFKVEHFINDTSLGFYAVKMIPIGQDIKGLSKILNEVELLSLLSNSSEHLIKYYHVWIEMSRLSNFSPVVPCAFILTEYCDAGNLEDLVVRLKSPNVDIKQQIENKRLKKKNGSNKARNLTEFEILKYLIDIVSGVQSLHENKIIHRDLKPSNCLLTTRYDKTSGLPHIKITDFGESQFEGIYRNSTGATGTLEFVAPELLEHGSIENKLNNFNRSTDVFGIGMILFFMCFGKLPYESEAVDTDYAGLRSKIKNFDIKEFLSSEEFSKKYKRNDLSHDMLELLSDLLAKEANFRPDTQQILARLNVMIERVREPNITGKTSEAKTFENFYNKYAIYFVILAEFLILGHILQWNIMHGETAIMMITTFGLGALVFASWKQNLAIMTSLVLAQLVHYIMH